MRAAVATQGELIIETVDDPVPGSGQVLVTTRANGICGSDLHTLDATKRGELSSDGPPVIPGHEFCAEVLDYGPSTPAATKHQWPVGTLVCANPFVGEGLEMVGGSARYPGGLAELMVLDCDRLLRVPDGLAPEQAALTEPLAVGIRAVAAASRRSDQGPYVVIGCGPIGLAVIVALRARGLGPIIASDLAPARRALATQLGADVVIAAESASPFESLPDFGFTESPPSPLLITTVEEASAPTIFECVGNPGVIQHIMESAPRHSRLVVVGVCLQPDTVLPVIAVIKEITMDFVFAYRPAEFTESLRRIAQGAVDVTSLITAQVGLDDTPWALEALRRGEHAKILVLPNDR